MYLNSNFMPSTGHGKTLYGMAWFDGKYLAKKLPASLWYEMEISAGGHTAINHGVFVGLRSSNFQKFWRRH